MSDNFEIRPSRLAGPLLASGLVVLLGAIGVALTVAAGGADFYSVIAVFLGIIFLLPIVALLWRSPAGNLLATRFGWMVDRSRQETGDYLPRAMRIRRRFGTNQAPTLEDIREAKEGLNNWVPAPDSRKRSK